MTSAVGPSPYQPTQENDECTLYIAESTIPGAGLGIFTTIEKHKGVTIAYWI